MSSLLLWLTVTILFAVGLIGTLIPVLPGLGFILAGIVLYAVATHFTTVSVSTVVVMTILAVLALGANYYAGALGAKVSGGGRYAVGGTIAGALIGMVSAGPAGLIIGAIVGAFSGALLEGRGPREAQQIALASLAGTIGGIIIQFVLGLVLIVAFLTAVFW